MRKLLPAFEALGRPKIRSDEEGAALLQVIVLSVFISGLILFMLDFQDFFDKEVRRDVSRKKYVDLGNSRGQGLSNAGVAFDAANMHQNQQEN